MGMGKLVTVVLVVLAYVVGFVTPLKDPTTSNKYSIRNVDPEYWQISIQNNDTALTEGSILHIGDDLSCYLRHQGPNDTLQMKRHNKMEFNRMLQENLERGRDIIVNSIRGCIKFSNGYWTYEYCPQKSLSQYHGFEPKSLNFVLGRPKESSQQREFRLFHNDFDYYVSEMIGSGDICDVTRSPRVVEIRYVCGSAVGSAVIQWVKEVKTCYYEIQIAMPKLCELELLSTNEEKKMSKPVLCVEKKPSEDIVGLLGKYQPTFLGSDFYLLEPRSGSTNEQRKVLLYSGDRGIKAGIIEKDAELLSSIENAFGNMLYQQLLMPPEGPYYEQGDEISWLSDVIDLHGNHLTRLQFDLNATSAAGISLSSNTTFPTSGNLLSYKKRSSKYEINANNKLGDVQKSKKLDMAGKGIKFLVLNANSGDPNVLTISGDDQDLLEQLDGLVLKELNTPEHLEEHSDMIYEQNDDPSFTTTYDELEQEATEVSEKQSHVEPPEQSRDVVSHDDRIKHDNALKGISHGEHELRDGAEKEIQKEDGHNLEGRLHDEL